MVVFIINLLSPSFTPCIKDITVHVFRFELVRAIRELLLTILTHLTMITSIASDAFTSFLFFVIRAESIALELIGVVDRHANRVLYVLSFNFCILFVRSKVLFALLALFAFVGEGAFTGPCLGSFGFRERVTLH